MDRKMKNTEAIKWLKEVQSHIDLEMGGNTQEMYDALELAIGKLQANDEQVIYEEILKFLKDHTIVELLEIIKDVVEEQEIRE